MTPAPTRIRARPLTPDGLAPFGDLLAVTGAPDFLINEGQCGRHHDLARLDFADGRAGISLFDARAHQLPVTLDLMERHPLGSQAFMPMSGGRYLVVVAADRDGVPDRPQAFLAGPEQGINLHRNVWHGVLTPLDVPGLFAVVDRIGAGANLQEHRFDTGYVIDV